ncbi:MAG: hypothetical protein ACI9CE_002603 [Flavobacterium sp.]|jgi:hypothetical protein
MAEFTFKKCFIDTVFPSDTVDENELIDIENEAPNSGKVILMGLDHPHNFIVRMYRRYKAGRHYFNMRRDDIFSPVE